MIARQLSPLTRAVSDVVTSMHQLSRGMHDAARADLADLADVAARAGQGRQSSMPRLRAMAETRSHGTRVPLLGLGFLGVPSPTQQAPVHWWFTPRDGGPAQQLVVNTQPRTLTYYDAAHYDWWQGALADPEAYASGPYVDVSGTNLYVVTFSKAVHIDGALAGLVAADIRVGDLQAVLREQLVGEADPVSIVDRDGAVIATNRGRLLGGTVEPGGHARCEDIAGTSWRIVREPETA